MLVEDNNEDEDHEDDLEEDQLDPSSEDLPLLGEKLSKEKKRSM